MGTGLVDLRQDQGDRGGARERTLRRRGHGQQGDAVTAGVMDDVAQLDRFARPRQGQDVSDEGTDLPNSMSPHS